MKRIILALILLLSLPAGAAPARGDDFPSIPPEIPEGWLPFFETELATEQEVAQTIVADLDGDGGEDWIVLGEARRSRKTWVHVYEPAKGEDPPRRKWRAPLYGDGFTMIRGFVTELRPFPQVLVVVQAEPFHTGDSRFRVQVIGWHKEGFRQLVPEHAEFRSQGGFTIEEAQEGHSGDSLLVWTYLREPGELLYDYHYYEYMRFHFDGMRFAVQDRPDRTKVKHAQPESAGVEAGATGPDLRRRVDEIAEVP